METAEKRIRTYKELVSIDNYLDRYEYLKLGGTVGQETFGFERYLNQKFYRTDEWRKVRDYVIVRDNGCDMAFDGREIHSRILIHHLNPVMPNDILERESWILDPEFLVCVCKQTHDAIHYGDESLLLLDPVIRTKNDTCPWRK